MKFDVDLCKRLEEAEAFGLRSAITYAMQTFPDRGIALEEIAGATVAYCGPRSPFNQASGIGVRCSVTDDDVDRIIAFYHSHGETARVEVSPVADAKLPAKLARRGFILADYENALVADLTEICGRRDSRIEVCRDADAWSYASALSFSDSEEPEEQLRFIGILMATHPDVTPLALREAGKIVTTACLGTEMDGIAGFFATSTMPHARGKGYQSAIIGDRIARAQEMGKTLARATAKVGSASERNFRRFGFTPVFTRTSWVLQAPA
ncbi:MAG: hypothetical protein JO165_07550 [Candidatus Eremiobacteraeota bacterium]|nr:hypothetical protein [Candidatus Eremiobacteraeota bacterium]